MVNERMGLGRGWHHLPAGIGLVLVFHEVEAVERLGDAPVRQVVLVIVVRLVKEVDALENLLALLR